MARRHFSDEQRVAFHRDGFVVVPGLFDSAAVRRIAAWTDEVQSQPEEPGRQWMYFEKSLLEPGARVLSRVENFCPFHEGFDALINRGELRGMAGELFGEPAVLFKEKINFKMPGGGGFAPHQDVQAGWDAYATLHLTVLVAIDPATEENGCLEMAVGYDRGRAVIGESWRPLDEAQLQGVTFRPIPTEPGDAVFFDSFVPHRSEPNLTATPRRVLYVTYNRLSEGDHRARYYADKHRNYPPDIERQAGKTYVFRV